MKSNTKIMLHGIIKELSTTLDSGIVVLNRENKVLIAEHMEDVAIGDTFTTKCRLDSEKLIETGKVNICIGTCEVLLVDYNELRKDMKKTLESINVDLNDINYISLPIGQGDNALGVLVVFVNEKLKEDLGVDRFQSLINTFYLTNNLIVDKSQRINEYNIRPIEDIEKEMMITALRRIGNSSYDISIISEKLGMNRSTFYRKCKKYNIDIQSIYE